MLCGVPDCWFSCISREDGIGWIAVRCPTLSEKVPRDSLGLQTSWEQLQESKRPINIHIITELAKAHAVTSGKWLIHVDTGLKVDHFWSLVAKATVEGRLGSSAKVSPAELSGENRRHVICIYNDNYTNQEEVYALECAIRNTGIKSHMTYKPDVYTCIGIYRNNEWGLRPTIYESHYDLVKGSIILSHFQDDR